MQNNYRARLFRGYILNAPWTFTAVWTAVKQFIEETTAIKINITSGSTEKKMFSHINKKQLEKKYGGEKEDIKEFWPFKEVQGEWALTQEQGK